MGVASSAATGAARSVSLAICDNFELKLRERSVLGFELVELLASWFKIEHDITADVSAATVVVDD